MTFADLSFDQQREASLSARAGGSSEADLRGGDNA
jgi:hypothetical protein